MAVKNSIHAVPLSTFDSAAVTGVYQPVITGGLAKPCFEIHIVNTSNQGITISYDGVNDHDFIPATSHNTIPALYPNQPNTFSVSFAQGTQIYVKGTAGMGTIYIAGYYQPQT